MIINRRRGGPNAVSLLLAAASLFFLLHAEAETKTGADNRQATYSIREVKGIPLASLEQANPDWFLREFSFPNNRLPELKAATSDAARFNRLVESYFTSTTRPPALNRSGGTGTIKNYKNGVLRIGPNPPVAFQLPFDWGDDELGLNFITRLHSLVFVSAFISEFERSGDRAFLNTAEDIVWDWVRANPATAAMHERAWFEGTTTLRALVLLHLFDTYRAGIKPRHGDLQSLVALISQHAWVISQERNYKRGNHGLRQNYALIAIALSIPEFRQSEEWIRLAIARLKDHVDTGFTTDGIYKEQSPEYHSFVMHFFLKTLDLLETHDVDMDYTFLKEIEKAGQSYLTHVLTPLGRFPPVGDSDEVRILDRYKAQVRTPQLRYSATEGAEGIAPKDLDGLFPDSGQAIFRNTWGHDRQSMRNATYVHIQAANHLPFGHRHADEQSFVLHSFGRWWILDPGKGTYEPGVERDFFKSPIAHNRYTFEDKALLSTTRGEGVENDVYIEKVTVSRKDLAAVRSYSSRFQHDNTEVIRTFVYLREHDILLLVDELHAPRNGPWQAYFHLAPDLELELDGVAVRASNPERTHSLEIIATNSHDVQLEVAKGMERPHYQGWYSPAYKKRVPTPVLTYNRLGKKLRIATLLRVGAYDRPLISDLALRSEKNRHTVSWRVGDREMKVKLNAEKPLTVSFLTD